MGAGISAAMEVQPFAKAPPRNHYCDFNEGAEWESTRYSHETWLARGSPDSTLHLPPPAHLPRVGRSPERSGMGRGRGRIENNCSGVGGTSPWLLVPGYHLKLNLEDVMHNVLLGIGQDAVASAIISMLEDARAKGDGRRRRRRRGRGRAQGRAGGVETPPKHLDRMVFWGRARPTTSC